MGNEKNGDINDTVDEKILSELKAIYEGIKREQQFAEAKNVALLVFYGALMGIVADISDLFGSCFAILVFIFISISIAIILPSFNPNTNSKSEKKEVEYYSTKEDDNLIFFGSIKNFTDGRNYLFEYYKNVHNIDLTDKEINVLKLYYANNMVVNSQITQRKFDLFKDSFRFFKQAMIISIIVKVLISIFGYFY